MRNLWSVYHLWATSQQFAAATKLWYSVDIVMQFQRACKDRLHEQDDAQRASPAP
jgi:hypothetical protein